MVNGMVDLIVDGLGLAEVMPQWQQAAPSNATAAPSSAAPMTVLWIWRESRAESQDAVLGLLKAKLPGRQPPVRVGGCVGGWVRVGWGEVGDWGGGAAAWAGGLRWVLALGDGCAGPARCFLIRLCGVLLRASLAAAPRREAACPCRPSSVG